MAKADGSKQQRSILQMTGERPSNAPILDTEKDGRLYATALLEKLEEELEGHDYHSAEAEEPDPTEPGRMTIYRTLPQYDGFARWMAELYKYGSQQAINGFNVVMTDYLGSVIDGSVPSSGHYIEMERKCRLPSWGSVIYSDPAAARAALAKGETSYTPGAKSIGKSKAEQGRSAREEEAGDKLDHTLQPFYALLDMGARYEKSPLSGLTARQAIKSMTESIRPVFDAVLSMIPAKHKARKYIAQALEALSDLDAFADDLDEDAELSISKRAQGRCIFAFALDAARAMERAQIAIVGRPSAGFLEVAQHPDEYEG